MVVTAAAIASPSPAPPDIIPDIINVTDFGAKGDWDCKQGTDNTLALQNAARALGSGSVLYFPRGTYKLSGTIAITNKSSVAVEGHGTLVQLRKNTPILAIVGDNHIRVSGLQFVGVAADYVNSSSIGTSDLITIHTSDAVTVESCGFSNFGFAAVSVESGDHLVFFNDAFLGPGRQIIPSGGNGNFALALVGPGLNHRNVLISSNTMKDVGTGVFIGNDWADIIISSNSIETVGQHGIYSYSRNTAVVGNTIRPDAGGGAAVFRRNRNNAADAAAIIVADNKIYGGGSGIVFTGLDGSTTRFIAPRILDNSLVGCGQPIVVRDNAGTCCDVRDADIEGNNISGQALSGPGILLIGSGAIKGNSIASSSMSGIYAATGKIEISNNTIANSGEGSLGGPAHQSAIFIENGTERAYIYENIILTGKGLLYAIYAGTNARVEQRNNSYPSDKPVYISTPPTVQR
jgi:hypothetical protein